MKWNFYIFYVIHFEKFTVGGGGWIDSQQVNCISSSFRNSQSQTTEKYQLKDNLEKVVSIY